VQNSREEFVARYLLERPHTAGSSTIYRNFSTFINYVVDQLVELDEVVMLEQLRSQYMKTLCRTLEISYIIRAIFTKVNRPVSKVGVRYHVIVAAIYVGQYWRIQHMFDVEKSITDIESDIFGTPFIVAIKTKQLDVVRGLLQRGANVNVSGRVSKKEISPLEKAVETQDVNLVQLLLEPQYGCFTFGEKYQLAISSAIQSNQPVIAHLLLQNSRDAIHELKPHVLGDGLRSACQHGLIDIVRRLIDGIDDVNDLDGLGRGAGMIEQAAWKGQEEVLRYLLSRGINPKGKTCSIRAAIWGGQIGTLRILLDAGVASQLNTYEWGTALITAAPLKGSVELVQMLFDSGDANINKFLYQHLVQSVILACQHGNAGFLEVLFRYGVSMKGDSSSDRYRLLPPVVIARAYRQHHVVRLLLDLGLPDVDPLKTGMGAMFASGRLPRDPPALPICRMPDTP
jgi:ankyrin repeat protein